MLYTDAPIITASTLTAIDPSVQDVSTASKIALAGQSGVILQGWTELGHDLIEWLESLTGDIYASAGLIIDVGLYASNRGRFLLNQVVTTGQWSGLLSPLAQYAAHKTLALFWAQALRSSKAADRFEKKWEMARGDMREAKRKLWANGIPINLNPLSCPGAQFDGQSAGVFGNLNVNPGPHAGSITQATAFDLAITWVDQTVWLSPLAPNNGESGPSPIVTTLLQSGQSLLVEIDNLIPAGGLPYLGSVADGVHYARNASGWNVYAALSGEPLVLQNATPIPLATQSYEMTTVATAGSLLGDGQVADLNQRPTRSFSRA